MRIQSPVFKPAASAGLLGVTFATLAKGGRGRQGSWDAIGAVWWCCEELVVVAGAAVDGVGGGLVAAREAWCSCRPVSMRDIRCL